MIKYPRLYVNGNFKRIVHPISLSITQNITPLDTASITLPIGEELPERSYVELFTPYGSAGMFRVRSPHDAYGQETTTAELEHMISEVGDYIVKDEISEMLPANQAMQRIFSHYGGNKWKLGTVSALGSGLIACEANYNRVLDNMLAILEQKKDCRMAFDFTTSPWTVKIVKKDTTVTAEGRLSRNVSSATVASDDTELVTRAWYQTFDSNNEGTWHYRDADTKGYYGIVEGTVRTSSDMTDNEINATVDAYINDHKLPRISVSIQAEELSQITGESIDQFKVGKLMRLNLADYGITVEETISSVVWNDVYGIPRDVTLNLGAEEDTVVTFLHNLDSKGRGGGGGGGARDKQEEQWKEYYTDFQKNDKYISMLAVHQSQTEGILEQAGLELNAQGLLVYANTKNGLLHQFDVLNNQFNSKITNTASGLRSQILQTEESIAQTVTDTANGLQSQITQNAKKIKAQASEIELKADKIELNGYVKATDITSDYLYAKITALDRVSVHYLSSNRGGINVYNVATTGFSQGGVSMYLPDAVSNVSLSQSGNTYTLTGKRMDGDTWTIGNFSRAVSLTGAWRNGSLTVTASPQEETYNCGLGVASGQAYRDPNNANQLKVPVIASSPSGTSMTGYDAWINWKPLLTEHTNCVAGLDRYNNGNKAKLYYYNTSMEDYYPVGEYYWYYRTTNGTLQTYYS